MKYYEIMLRGLSPYMSDPHPGTYAETKDSVPKAKATPRQIATKKVYRDDKQRCCISADHLFEAMKRAGIYQKDGKRQLTSAQFTMVAAAIDVQPALIPILPNSKNGTKDFEVDSRFIPNRMGQRVENHRPRWDRWYAKFTLEVDDEQTPFDNLDVVRRLVDDAGRRIGIGTMRPERGGRFGRFVVESWKDVTDTVQTREGEPVAA